MPAYVVVDAIGVQKLQEMSRPYFVYRNGQQIGFTRNVGKLVFLGPGGVRRCDVIHRGQVGLERARNIDVGSVKPAVWR